MLYGFGDAPDALAVDGLPVDDHLAGLALGLQQGDEATLQATGENESEAIEIIAAAFEREYDFPPQN